MPISETKETSNKQPNPTTKATKREQNPHKVSRRKSSRSEQLINEKEMKKTAKTNKTKSWFFDKINKIDKPLARTSRK